MVINQYIEKLKAKKKNVYMLVYMESLIIQK